MATVTFTNNTGMTIADNATTVQWVDVSGLLGTIVSMEITIYGLSHAWPIDLDFMLARMGISASYFGLIQVLMSL